MKAETITDKIKSKLQESSVPRENLYIKRSINEQKLTSVINNLGLDFAYSYKVPETKLVADFFHKPSKTIIEVNGPSHYIKKFEGHNIVVTDQLNGRSSAKMTKLREKGFKCATINFNLIKSDSTDEELARLLSKCI